MTWSRYTVSMLGLEAVFEFEDLVDDLRDGEIRGIENEGILCLA